MRKPGAFRYHAAILNNRHVILTFQAILIFFCALLALKFDDDIIENSFLCASGERWNENVLSRNSALVVLNKFLSPYI